jgi:hypothetical protein
MSRTPYSPFVLNATAPEPWKAGRGAIGGVGALAGVTSCCVRGASSIPSDLVGIVRRPVGGRNRVENDERRTSDDG